VIPQNLGVCENASQDLQELLSIICTHRRINTVVWSNHCNTEDEISYQELEAFQDSLRKWREQSVSTFQGESEPLDHNHTIDSMSLLPIPPEPRVYPSLDAALAAATFHAYMGRSLCMMSTTNTSSEKYEVEAIMHAYQNLRILKGLQENSELLNKEHQLLSCNNVKIGFIPLLFLGAQFCLNSAWLRFTTDMIRFVGHEGLYSGELFAGALQSLEFFQAHAQKTLNTQPASNAGLALRFRTIPVLIPGPQEKSAVAYYVRDLGLQSQGPPNYRGRHVQIVGRVRWQRNVADASTNVSMEFFDAKHAINEGLKDRCLYFQLAVNEPVARDWETLLGPEALGQHSYFIRLAAARHAFDGRTCESLGTAVDTII